MTAELTKVCISAKMRSILTLRFPGILRRLLDELRKRGIITEDLCVPKDLDELELVYRGLCRKDTNSRRRRIGKYQLAYKQSIV